MVRDRLIAFSICLSKGHLFLQLFTVGCFSGFTAHHGLGRESAKRFLAIVQVLNQIRWCVPQGHHHSGETSPLSRQCIAEPSSRRACNLHWSHWSRCSPQLWEEILCVTRFLPFNTIINPNSGSTPFLVFFLVV